MILLADRLPPGWANDPVDNRKFDRNSVELPRYADIERRFSQNAQHLTNRYLRGEINESHLIRAFKNELVEAETDAFISGRRARGEVRSWLTDAEGEMLDVRHGRNMKYFQNFVGDMKAGRGRMNYARRTDMYSKSLWSLYTRGESSDWQDPENDNARYYWQLDPDAEHCKDCIERAGKSRDQDGFTWEEMSSMGWPGETTICMVKCRCHVRVVKKALVLPERFDNIGQAANPSDGFKTLEELLGGETYPLRVPAAGVPGVRVSPKTVREAVAVDPLQDELAKRLPLIPQALTKPDILNDDGTTRRYLGQGLDILLGRDSENGMWQIIGLSIDPFSLLGIGRAA